MQRPTRWTVLVIGAALLVQGCQPGFAVLATNDGTEPRLLRYFEAGGATVIELPAGGRGLVAIGNAPAPSTVDILAADCSVVAFVRIEREGGTVIGVSGTTATATPTSLPQEITEPLLGRTTACGGE